MSDYFTKLAAKTLNTTPIVRPLLHSWFGAPTQFPAEEFGEPSAMPLSRQAGASPHEVTETSETAMQASRPDARLISRKPTPASPEPYANNASIFSVSPQVSLNFPESGFETRQASASVGPPVVNPGEPFPAHVVPLRHPNVTTQASGLNSVHDLAAAVALQRSKPEPWSGSSGKLAAESRAVSISEKQETKLSPGSEPEWRKAALPIATRKAVPVAQVPLRAPTPNVEPIEFPETPPRLRGQERLAPEKALELNFPMMKRAASRPFAGRQEETLPDVVQVSIGRIEVRAATAPERPRKERPAASSSSALENYLSRRGGGA